MSTGAIIGIGIIGMVVVFLYLSEAALKKIKGERNE